MCRGPSQSQSFVFRKKKVHASSSSCFLFRKRNPEEVSILTVFTGSFRCLERVNFLSIFCDFQFYV